MFKTSSRHMLKTTRRHALETSLRRLIEKQNVYCGISGSNKSKWVSNKSICCQSISDASRANPKYIN